MELNLRFYNIKSTERTFTPEWGRFLTKEIIEFYKSNILLSHLARIVLTAIFVVILNEFNEDVLSGNSIDFNLGNE